MERIESSFQEAKSAFWNTTSLLGTLADETELGANYNVFSRSDLGVGMGKKDEEASWGESPRSRIVAIIFYIDSRNFSFRFALRGVIPTCNRVEERIHVFNSEVLDCQLIDGKWN